jgi:hypothetical protein
VSPDRRVDIHYRRPPDRVQVFHQRLVLDRDDVKITLAESMEAPAPMRIEGTVAMEAGSDLVWFTFPELWHDIGRFHRADGTFTGYYANVLTPPEIEGSTWGTTDLYLDVWLTPGASPVLLDEDEFDLAVGKEWIDGDTARRALEEATHIMEQARAGTWPPPVVREWTLERVREELGI